MLFVRFCCVVEVVELAVVSTSLLAGQLALPRLERCLDLPLLGDCDVFRTGCGAPIATESFDPIDQSLTSLTRLSVRGWTVLLSRSAETYCTCHISTRCSTPPMIIIV